MENVAVHLGERFLHAASGLGRNDRRLNRRRNLQEREACRIVVTNLDRKFREVDRADIDPRGSARLHPGGRNAEGGQLVRHMIGRKLTDATAFERMRANEHLTVQEGSRGQNNRPRFENCPGNRTDARQNAILKEKIFNKIRVNA